MRWAGRFLPEAVRYCAPVEAPPLKGRACSPPIVKRAERILHAWLILLLCILISWLVDRSGKGVDAFNSPRFPVFRLDKVSQFTQALATDFDKGARSAVNGCGETAVSHDDLGRFNVELEGGDALGITHGEVNGGHDSLLVVCVFKLWCYNLFTVRVPASDAQRAHQFAWSSAGTRGERSTHR